MRELNVLHRDTISQSRYIINVLDFFTPTHPDYGWGLVLPYYPLTLETLLTHRDQPLRLPIITSIFFCVFSGLCALHALGIIHRDIKPSAILLASPHGPAVLSDLGTAFIPDHQFHNETASHKILDIGSGPYRAPEALFAKRDYGPSLDIWAAGCVLAECVRGPPRRSLFTCPPAHEDGSQLLLIQSMFDVLGTPDASSWPSAAAGTGRKPWEMWTSSPPRPWSELLPRVNPLVVHLVQNTVLYEETARLTALQARNHPLFKRYEHLHEMKDLEVNPRRLGEV